MATRKGTKGQTAIYKTLHRKLKIEQQEYYLNQGVNSFNSVGSLERCLTMLKGSGIESHCVFRR